MDTATLREVINRLDGASLNRLRGDIEKANWMRLTRRSVRALHGDKGGLIDPLHDPPRRRADVGVSVSLIMCTGGA